MTSEVKIIIRALDAYSKVFKNVENDMRVFSNNLRATRSAEADYYNFVQTRSRQTTQARTADIQQQVAIQKELDQAARRSAQEAQRAAAKQAQAAEEIRKRWGDTLPVTRKVIEGFRDMAMQIGVATGIILGFATAVKTAYDFSEQGAQIERLRTVGTKLAESYGVNMTEAVNKLKEASQGTITSQQAILDVNRALLLGVAADTETLARLMEIAVLRGRAMGVSTEEAFRRITLGIGKTEKRILDELGIVVDAETAFTEYGRSIHKTADELTEAEKRIAITNAVLEEGNRLLEVSGGLVYDNATAYEQLSVDIIDATNILKEYLSDALTPSIISLVGLYGLLVKIHSLTANHNKEVLETSESYEDYSQEVDRASTASNFFRAGLVGVNPQLHAFLVTSGLLPPLVEKLTRDEYALARAIDDRRESIERLMDILGFYAKDSIEPVIDATRRWKEGHEQATNTLERSASGIGKTIEGLRKLNEIQEDLNESLAELDIDFSRRQEDDRIDLERTIRDIEIKFANDEEDRARDQARTLENIERDHQREIDRIMRRFELARLKALIDLDARALFEAEAQRDADLADAKASAEEKRRDEARDEEERKREDDRRKQEEIDRAKRHFEDQQEDARRHYDQEQQDLIAAAVRKSVEIAQRFGIELQNIKYYLSQETLAYQGEYTRQLTDLILYMQQRNNILSGALGVVPGGFTGGTTEPVPDAGVNDEGAPVYVPPGEEDIYYPPGGGPGALSRIGGTGTTQNVRVTLNIEGDGMLARMVRESALNALVDVISE